MDAKCDWNMISKIRVYHATRRHELYTAGCIASREIEMCEQEVASELFLRCEGPTPVVSSSVW